MPSETAQEIIREAKQSQNVYCEYCDVEIDVSGAHTMGEALTVLNDHAETHG